MQKHDEVKNNLFTLREIYNEKYFHINIQVETWGEQGDFLEDSSCWHYNTEC